MENNIETTDTQNTEVQSTDTQVTESSDSYYDNEMDALNSLMDDDFIDEEQTVENTDDIDSNIETNENINQGDDNEIDLSNVDLSFLGIDSSVTNEDNTKKHNEVQTNQQNDTQLDQIKEMIEKMNGPKDNEPQQMQDEEAQAVTALFEKFKQLGLIPENNGLNEEQQQLLEDVKKMNESFKQEQEEKKAFEEHQSKLTSLKEFDKELSETIPGYNSEFMQKVVGDINKTNPDAAKQIFENPTLLIKLWKEVGAKSQPSKEQQNIISSKSQSINKITELEEKVNNGTATEWEEAQFLNSL